MGRRGKTIILFLILLSIISLLIAVWGLLSFQKERAARIAMKEQLDEIQSKRNVLEVRLKEIEKDNNDMQVKLKESEEKIISLNEDLNKEKDSKDKAFVELDRIKEELKSETDTRLDLANRLKSAEDELNGLREQVRVIESTKASLEEKLKGLEKKTAEVDLEKIVVNSPEESLDSNQPADSDTEKTSSSAPLPLEGKVLVVNKENAFVVINLGESEGLKIKDIFSIYRQDKFLGDIEVEELREHMSIAKFLSDDLKNQIKENDRVVRK